MQPAPLYADVARGPANGRAFWLKTTDGLRIRAGLWPCEGARGTVLLFPGRTEYIEKYGPTAGALQAHGLATLVVDWRGQGLSDRLGDDLLSGHVLHFRDYQADVRALLDAARHLGLPRPFHLLAHSMGGCIGLRALIEGLPVTASVFSGPMWGIRIRSALRPVAWSLSWSARQVGLGRLYTPGSCKGIYVCSEPFETNRLTRDPQMYRHMIDQTRTHPDLALGGPSLRWLHEALLECRVLARLPAPAMPCLTIAGSQEDIVTLDSIRRRMGTWPGGQLDMVEGGRHEVLMDLPEVRQRLIDRIGRFYARAAQTATGPLQATLPAVPDMPLDTAG